MDKLIFSKTDISSLEIIRPYLYSEDSFCCDYSVGFVTMWQKPMSLSYAIYDDILFIKSKLRDGKERFFMPCTQNKLSYAVDILKKYSSENNIELEFTSVSPTQYEKLCSIIKGEYTVSRDYSDYVYGADNLEKLSGKAYHQKRNHISSFKKKYENYVYERINSENISEVKKFYEEYRFQNPPKDNSEKIERECSEFALNNYENIGFIGAYIKVNEKVIAFTLGEIKNDMLIVHVEKADRSYDGVYAVINNEFVKDCRSSFGINWVNREDDSGEPGLRKAKLSYHPAFIAEKGRIINVK